MTGVGNAPGAQASSLPCGAGGKRARRRLRIGIFGGTFNPVHIAHLILAEEVRERFRLDTMIFIPSGKPPHKGMSLPEGRHRLEMVRLAIEGNRCFTADDLEVRRTGKSYTIETLRELKDRYPRSTDFFFLIGMDAFRDITTWHEADLLCRYAHFVVVPRTGYPLGSPRPWLPPSLKLSTPRHPRKGIIRYPAAGGKSIFMTETEILSLSASTIRRRAAAGSSLRYLVPEAVEKYIARNRLY